MMHFGSFQRRLGIWALVFLLAVPAAQAERAIIDPFVGAVKAATVRRTPLRIHGQPAVVIEKLNSSGRVLARLVSWPDHLIVAIDHYGQGQLDTWEMYSSEAHIRLWAPAKGAFHLMDVDTFKGSKRVTARFARTENGEFVLIEQALAPGGILFEEAAPGGPSAAGAGVDEATEAPVDVRKRIEAVQEKSLEQAVNKLAAGCTSDDKEKLVSAVSQVVMSDVATGDGEEPGRHLKCLRSKGYETTANAIAARFFATQVPDGSAPATWSISCPKCDKQGGLCSGPEPKNGSYQVDGRGGRPEMSIVTAKANPAATVLHESLHAVGVISEKEAQSLTKCCAQGAAGDCRDVEQKVAIRDRTQVYMSSYFSLPAETRKKVDKASRVLEKNAGGSQVAVRYLSKLADRHQAVFAAHRGGECKEETSDSCQVLLRDAEKKTFEQEVGAKCGKVPAPGCQKAVAEIASVIGPKKGPGALNLAEASRLIKEGLLARGPVSYHQLPVAQMAEAASRAGQQAVQNLPPGAGTSKAVPYQGPKLLAWGIIRDDKADRVQIDMADVLSKQTGVVSAIVNRVAKLAGSLVAAVPLQAAHVPDPSAVHGKTLEAGMSARMKKLLTPKTVTPAVETRASLSPQAAAVSPAQEKVRQDFIKQMTSADEKRLKVDLANKGTLKSLSDYNIGVIDQNGARRDQTANPTRWLIYDEESGRLQFLDADDSSDASK